MRTQDWLQPLRGRGLTLAPVVNGAGRSIIQPPLNVQSRPLQNEVLPSHECILKEKCGIRNFSLALSAESAYVQVMKHMETSFQNGQAAQPHQEGGDWFTHGAGFRVIWRNGGTKRFRWQRVLRGFPSREEAQDEADSIIKMGYHAEVREPSSLRHGLPESWDSKTSASDFRETAGGWMIPA